MGDRVEAGATGTPQNYGRIGVGSGLDTGAQTRKPCYDRAMRPMYKLFTQISFTLTARATILCADFDSERI